MKYRYEAEIAITVYFDSETEPDDMTREELESRTADAVHDNHILDSRVYDWEWVEPSPLAEAGSAKGEE